MQRKLMGQKAPLSSEAAVGHEKKKQKSVSMR